MHIEELLDLISKGENSCVEFKSTIIRPDSFAKELVAFANSSGGVILFGISDDSEIVGDEKVTEEWCMNVAATNCNPPVQIGFEERYIDEKRVPIITIEKGINKPYQLNDGKFYIRLGSTNRIATLPELMRLFQQNGVFHYDAIPVENSSFRSLDSTQLSTYFNRYSLDYDLLSDDEKVRMLTNSDILTSEEKVSVAGLLLFGTYPQKYLKMNSIAFAHFEGESVGDTLIDKQIIEGTLPRQVDTVLALIKSSIKKPSIIEGSKRIDSAQLPDKVFRELIVNACCHRNYSITGSQIRVFVFDDRIEFLSPGRLPNTISVEKLPYGVSYAVNPIIVKFMENLGYIDKLGRGLPMVKQECDRLNRKVEFIEFGEEFKVVIEI